MFLQLARLVGVFYPLGPLESGGMGKKERNSKMAATNKVQTIVEHAMFLHDVPPKMASRRVSSVSETVWKFASSLHQSKTRETRRSSRESQNQSTASKALLNFHRMNDTVEGECCQLAGSLVMIGLKELTPDQPPRTSARWSLLGCETAYERKLALQRRHLPSRALTRCKCGDVRIDLHVLASWT